MKLKYNRIISALIMALAVLPGHLVGAADSALSQELQSQKTQLEQELAQIEEQIARYTKELGVTQSQKNTLNNKIKQLKITQQKIVLQIRNTTLKLNKTRQELNKTQVSINNNERKISLFNAQIAEILRQIYMKGQQTPLFQIFLYERGLSGFIDELQNYETIDKNLVVLLNQANKQTAELTMQQERLADQQQEQKNLIAIQNLQSHSLSQTISEQNVLLKQTKGQEANYQSIIKDKKKKAVAIKNRIYELFSVTRQVTFGQAVAIAQFASGQTGVRTAFILAILTQESNLGKNVGTCNRADDPPEKSWRVIMKPSRDQEPFLQITRELGLDPNTTPVSCPMRDKNGKQIGWGGAMGPAQFIPSTWMGYRAKVAAVTGKPANPWDIRDAFMAAAIKLKADGGDSVSGEWASAMRYFSGSTNLAYRFYGDNVVAIANRYQDDIDSLNN
ncbi:MAG: hypothetical protein WC621_04745 [Patescibacteria group bacterium]